MLAHIDADHPDSIPPRRHPAVGQPVRSVISGAAQHLPPEPPPASVNADGKAAKKVT
jgi:hypothetical protein